VGLTHKVGPSSEKIRLTLSKKWPKKGSSKISDIPALENSSDSALEVEAIIAKKQRLYKSLIFLHAKKY